VGGAIGLAAFGGATAHVLKDNENQQFSRIPAVAYDYGTSLDSSLDYRYTASIGGTRPDDMLHQDVGISVVNRQTMRLGLRKVSSDVSRGEYVSPLVGYTQRRYDVEVNGVTERGAEQVWLVGAESGWPIGRSWSWHIRYLWGMGDLDIPQLDDTPPYPGGDSSRIRCTQLSCGMAYSLFSWCQLTTDIGMDTVAMPHQSHVNDGLIGGDNSYRLFNWTAGCTISHEF